MTKTQTLPRKSPARTTGTVTPKKTSAKKAHRYLEDLLEDGLREIYSAEKQLMQAMPDLAGACYSEDLQDAVKHHLDETKRHPISGVPFCFSGNVLWPNGQNTSGEQCNSFRG